MQTLSEKVMGLERQVIELKAQTPTLADSNNTYMQIIDLGSETPSSYDYAYRWDIYVAPTVNDENAIFCLDVTRKYGWITISDLGRFPIASSTNGWVDINDNRHFIVTVSYWLETEITYIGTTQQAVIYSNVPFYITSATRTRINSN